MVVRVGGRKGCCRLGVGGERQPLAVAVALVAANINNMQPSLPQGPYLESMRRSNASAYREHSRYHARHRHMGKLQCGQRCFTLNQRRRQLRWQGLPHPDVQNMSDRVESSSSRQMGQTSVGSAVRRGTRDLQPASQTTSPFRQDATEMAKVHSKTKVHSTVHSTESKTIVSRAWRSEAFKTGCCSSGASKADQTANVRLEKRLGAASAMSPTLGLLMARAEVPKMPRHSHGIMPTTGSAQSPSTHAMAICCAYSGDHSAMAFIANTRHPRAPSIAARPLVFRRVCSREEVGKGFRQSFVTRAP